MRNKEINIVAESKNMTATIIRFAWPVLLESLLTSLIGYIDTAMVGSLGKNATAAVALCSSPGFMIHGTMSAIGVGFTALIARAIGAGEPDKAKKISQQAWFCTLGIGLPLTVIVMLISRYIPIWMGGEPDVIPGAAFYMLMTSSTIAFQMIQALFFAIVRGYGDMKTPLAVNVTVNIVHIIFNLFLIYPDTTHTFTVLGKSFSFFTPGFGLGVKGAAISTAAVSVIGCLMMIFAMYCRPKKVYHLSFKDKIKVDFSQLKTIFAISLPAVLETFGMSAGSVATTRAVASLGTVSLSTHSLSLTAENICYHGASAFATATTTIVGQSLGAGRQDLARAFVKRVMTICTILMTVLTAGLFFFGKNLLSLFTPDADIIVLGTVYLKIIAFEEIPQGIDSVLAGALRGAGDTKATFLIIFLSMWIVRIGCSVLLITVFHMGVYAAAICMLADHIVRAIVFYIRFKGEKWMTKLKD